MTTIHTRPSLQDMVKQAMAGTTNALQVNLEAARQSAQGTTKTASKAPVSSSSVSTEMVSKLASALGYIEAELRKEAEGPGEGPGALTVMESNVPGVTNGDSGQATSKNQPPMNPALQPEQVQEGSAGTGLETNDDMSHPAQPVEPIKNASAMGKMMAARDAAKGAVGKGKALVAAHPKAAKGVAGAAGGLALGGAVAGGMHLHGKREVAKDRAKQGSAPIALLRKLAEDAINPAQISVPKGQGDLPEGASASGEGVPSEPSDVSSQKSMIASNEAAINYTKGQAKADPKKDVNQVLTEPALTSSTDKVLNEAFTNTGAAGVKISAAKDLQKTAAQVGAQRVILDRLLKKASADVATVTDKKTLGAAPTTPQAATGASAATMGQ